MSLAIINFESKFLANNTEVGIFLPNPPKGVMPKEFYPSEKRYPVLWLLHGTFGDYSDWIRKTMIELYARERELIVVMPSALNTNYSNWPDTMAGIKMFDFLTEELMPLIYSWFPASDINGSTTFIAGLSMGGEGAAKYAVNYPDKFGGAAILSMYIQNLRRWLATGRSLARQRKKKSFPSWSPACKTVVRNAGGLLNYINSYENLWDKFTKLCGTGVLPKLYFTCGADDFLFEGILEFKRHAEKIGLDAKFEEVEGFKHEWRFGI
jgi:putative tributyrin esterase